MKAILLIFGLGLMAATSCKKAVDDVKKNYVLDIMTDGKWFVESYTDAGTSITNQFFGYVFKFNEDGTVTSTKGTAVQTGTWVGDIRNYSITSNFPDAGEPLLKLNGTWVVKDSSENFVLAEMGSGNNTAVLKLRKVE